MNRIVLAACLVAFALQAEAEPKLPSFPKGTTYGNARSSLEAVGWKPVANPDKADICGESDDRCQWLETVSCSGTGVGACLYRWRRAKTVIAIGTRGDDPQTVYSIRCEINCR